MAEHLGDSISALGDWFKIHLSPFRYVYNLIIIALLSTGVIFGVTKQGWSGRMGVDAKGDFILQICTSG